MSLDKILAEKDPSRFRTRNVRIQKQAEGYSIQPQGYALNFAQMSAMRKPADKDRILEGVNGEGYVFANLGVSGVVTLKMGNEDYMVLVKQTRKGEGFNDQVAKLVSGYISLDHLDNPIKAFEEEAAEEFIFATPENNLLPFKREESALALPYSSNQTYDQTHFVSLLENRSLSVPCEVRLNPSSDKPSEQNSGLYMHAPTNSAQILFHYELILPSNIDSPLSLYHAEDRFNKRTGKLETHLDEEGSILGRLDSNRLTGDFYFYRNGKLVSYQEPVNLSEAFSPHQDGIVYASNISLKDYLANK